VVTKGSPRTPDRAPSHSAGISEVPPSAGSVASTRPSRQNRSMDTKCDFEYVAPVIPVRDLDAALGRYRALGFAAELYTGGERYAESSLYGSIFSASWSSTKSAAARFSSK
jgi:hypothetical protein